MGDPFDRDLDRFRLDPDGLVRTELPVTKRRRDKSFLPAIPERLFCRLVQLPGKCLAVYMVLMLRCRLGHQRSSVPLTGCYLRRFGLTKFDKLRALRHLEAAGLVRVERRANRNPLVTITNPNERAEEHAD